jgi:hypothetical protein
MGSDHVTWARTGFWRPVAKTGMILYVVDLGRYDRNLGIAWKME